MKCVALGGIPASGKSTIVQQFFINNEYWNNFEYRRLKGHYNKTLNLLIIGVYGTAKFAGTDKLSMSVQPDFESFIRANYGKTNILFEGDRLFSLKNIQFLDKYYELKVGIITSKHTEDRHKTRRDNQSEKFIKGRITKINNIKQAYQRYTVYENNTENSVASIYQDIFNYYK
jgi:hypothetical protein|tara:strand:- start:260 stop:778 length:519 start_codon:yes stop_codon:yes gene_type:complete